MIEVEKIVKDPAFIKRRLAEQGITTMLEFKVLDWNPQWCIIFYEMPDPPVEKKPVDNTRR
jgi:hypothetical protein